MTKRILSFVLSAMLLFLLVSCTENMNVTPADMTDFESSVLQIKTGTVREEFRREDSGKLFYYSEYPEIMLSDGDAVKYPGLAEALEELVAEKKAIMKTPDQEMKDFIEEMKEYAPDMELCDTLEANVRRADDVALSLQIYHDSYSGGAHGYFFFEGVTFDTKTGKKLSWSDVVTDEEKFFDAIVNELDKIKDMLFEQEITDLRKVVREDNMFEWTLENDGITVYFAPYAIAPFASGAPSVKIKDYEYPGLIKEEYISNLHFFATEIGFDTFAYDVTGDGKKDEISAYVWPLYYYETGMGRISVSVNGNEWSKDIENLDDGDVVFTKTPDGKCYILMSLLYKDSADDCILSFELGDDIEEPKTAEGLSFYYEESEKTPMKWVITNPESFFLEDENGSFHMFRIGKDGLPERKNG